MIIPWLCAKVIYIHPIADQTMITDIQKDQYQTLEIHGGQRD